MKPDKYKIIDKQIFWWNGEKYLVKETFQTNKEAEDAFKIINDNE